MGSRSLSSSRLAWGRKRWVLLLAMMSGCAAESTAPTAPAATEQLDDITAVDRQLDFAERLPFVVITGGAGHVIVRVVRPAFCGTLVSARVARQSGELNVVTRVSGDPAADCIAGGPPLVVDYAVRIPRVPAGPHLVRFYEGVGDQSPQFITSTRVVVSSGGTP